MARIKFVLVSISILLSSCASNYEHNANWRQQGYDREKALMEQQMANKEITVMQAHRQMMAASKTYFPNDPLLAQLWEDLSILAEQFEKQEIPLQEFVRLSEMRWRLFDDANVQRHSEARYLEAQQRRSEFMGNFLAGMARSMQRNNPPVINCSTTSMPGVLTTNCQ